LKDTKIRWAGSTLNVGIGCEHVSPGCDHCYADVLATKYAGTTGWPASFEEGIWKPQKLKDIDKWAKQPRRIFVNSLSDAHWRRWTNEQVTALYDAMLAQPCHDYLVLTKRPQRMANFMLGRADSSEPGWLERRNLAEVPPHIWLGTTIENNDYVWRADHLRRIPVMVRFLSCEPLIGPVPDLDLTGIGWVIAGGESGNGSRNFRPMPLEWATELMAITREAGAAFYFKQASGVRTEMGKDALGQLYEEYPLEHPEFRQGERVLGIFTDPAPETPVTVGRGGQASLL
jgi:protein gp37